MHTPRRDCVWAGPRSVVVLIQTVPSWCVCVLRVYGDGGQEQGTRAGTRKRRNTFMYFSQHIMPARTAQDERKTMPRALMLAAWPAARP
eukprot:1366413-Prymnesium_polylepis.1